MNLRVDLILETEQRSASFFNKRTILRGAAVVVPLLLLTLVAAQVAQMVRLRGRLETLESEWRTAEPREQEARRRSEQYRTHVDLKRELDGWKQSHVDWHAQLSALMQQVPPNIQLQLLRLDQVLPVIDNRVPARVFSLTLQGKATGADAESSVRTLERRLLEAESFTGLMTNVVVQQFGADRSRNASREDRVFEIGCRSREFRFE